MKKSLFLFVLTALALTGCGTKSESPATSQSGSSEVSTSSESSSSSSSSEKEVEKFTITFKDESGNVLESKKWEKDSIPSYNYQKQDTAEWDYTVEGWSNSLGGGVISIPPVTADATYFAVVTSVKQKYQIAFYKENGDQIKSEKLEFGVQPTCDYVGPSDTAQYDYTFHGWATTLGGNAIASIPTVSKAANYYAVVTNVTKKYNVTFYDENGTQLAKTSYDYGQTPSYTYTKTDTDEWDYTMEGWSTSLGGEALAKLPAVEGDASYFAVVSKVKKQYTITFNSHGGSTVSSITKDYGTIIQEPTKPTYEGYKFTGWTVDKQGGEQVTWPLTLTKDYSLHANWNEKVDIKGFFTTLMGALKVNPKSYIPDAMQAGHNTANESDITYDFNNFTSVSSIKYGGFGEQWHMVIENIAESERYYKVTTLCETAINASVVVFNNYLDKNTESTASHSIKETDYTASINYASGILKYSLRYDLGLSIPFFGDVVPQIDMTYNVTSLEKMVRIQLTENNAMKYVVNENHYQFALQYGVEQVSRKAFFEVERDEEENVEGHIYEYVQFKDKDLVPSCADFYIGETYTSVVGNKASGIPGFAGYINELYETEQGKLIGYKVRETFTKWGFEATYHTLWFNLNNITGITNVKAVSNGGVDPHENNHDVYLNSSETIFTPTKNKKLLVSTSRKYDVEMRKQYFYSTQDDSIVEHETSIPMMFIQDDHDEYTNYSDFHKDILKDNKIDASVNLATKYLTKIRADYDELIDVFIEHKGSITGDYIQTFIGSAEVID